MNSRERVNAVLRHELPDRIPNCWGGCETAGLHVLSYERLVRVLGLPERAPRVDTFMFNAVPDDDVLRAMEGDLLLLASPRMCARPLRSKEGWHKEQLFGTTLEMTDNYSIETTPDGMTYLLDNGKRCMRSPKDGSYFDFMPGGSIFDEEDVPDPKDYHPSHTLGDEMLRELENAAKSAWENTDFGLCMGETVQDLQLTPGGMIPWYEAMINEPDIVSEYLEKSVDAALDQITELDQAVGKYCCILSIAHDLGDQRGVTMGPDLFRKCYKAPYTRFFAGWHKRTNMKVNLHSCGSIVDILPDLIECGVDILNPVQLSANGMDARRLRDIASDKLILYGGALDCIQSPETMTEEAIYEKVKSNLRILAENGNYFFAGVHNTVANTPETHIRAMLQAYNDCKFY